MTSETIMQVLMVYPDARCIFCEKSDVWCVVETHLGGVIGEGDTQFEAWDDAASRLTETKLPSSPAGDCFPYSPTSMAAAVGYVAEDKKPTQPLDENQLWGSPAGEIAVCAHCELPFKKCKCEPTKPLLTKWIPEPLGDISGPKGSGGAAPEAADELDAMKHLLRDYIDEELRGGLPYDRYSILTTRAMKLLGMTAPPPLLEQWRKELGLPPAAPIAPAAQEHTWTQREADFFAERNAAWELVQELVDVCEEIDEYLNDYIDADHNGEYYVPNRAMRLQTDLRAALARAAYSGGREVK